MITPSFSFLVLFPVTISGTIKDEQYRQMPKLFALDDYNDCLSTQGTFCLGTFDLLPFKNNHLFSIIQRFSEDKHYFNHSRLHRGFCLSSRCRHISGHSITDRFERCVDSYTRMQYGLQAKLTRLDYCKSSTKPTTGDIDGLDIAFACFIGAIVFCNIIGTSYDMIRDKGKIPNHHLMPWSLIANWKRLTADQVKNEQKLSALLPIQGIKAISMMHLINCHSILVHYMTYTLNPHFLEKLVQNYSGIMYMQNGTSIVHIFILVSSFLLAYNLLLSAHGNPKNQLSLKMLPKVIIGRLIRICPLYLTLLGFTSTWWSRLGDGVMWQPLVVREHEHCRKKFWAQAFFINNLLKTDFQCLQHTWYVAIDMQMFIISAILTLTLGRNPRSALKILAAIFIGSMFFNLAVVTCWKLKHMVVLLFPEIMHSQLFHEESFSWLYTAPWNTLPTAIIGLFVAFLLFNVQQNGYQPNRSTIFKVLFRLSIPLIIVWILLVGHWVVAADQLWLSLYTVIDRPVVVFLAAIAMFGCIYKVDSFWWKFFSWRCWVILGRMSLTIYLFHWVYTFSLVGMRSYLSPASQHEIGGHWLWTLLCTYITAIPLHLCIELPMQQFLNAFIAGYQNETSEDTKSKCK